jgi:Amt family ammonium transporter
MGGVSFMSQLIGTSLAIFIAVTGSFIIYRLLKQWVGIRLNAEEEFDGADLSIHKISSTTID